MFGDATPPCDRPDEWFDLIDPATDRTVGQVTRRGAVRHSDPEVTRRIRAAFGSEIMCRGGEIAEELGVCFADVGTVTPGGAAHAGLVFRNLALLTGLMPRQPVDPEGRESS